MRNMLLLLSLLLVLAGCDIFAVRDSEPPTTPAPWWSYATDWGLCLENLEWCYEDSRNAVKYSGLFTEDFAFTFAAQDVTDFVINGTLNRAQEQDMLRNLHTASGDIDISLSTLPGQNDDIGPNEATISRKYTLLCNDPDNLESTVYSGDLELQFKKVGGYWYISKWYDYRDYDYPTWGKLKYDHRQ